MNESTLPNVTVIMPVRNESEYIVGALGAVLAQDYPPSRMQILVVDGRSTDDTCELVQDLSNLHPEHSVEIVDNPGRIAPCALNAGLVRATGDIVVRVDGHCEIGPEYVRNGVKHLTADRTHGFETGEQNRGQTAKETSQAAPKSVAGVGGILDTVGETPQAQAIAVAMSSRFGVGGSAFRTSEADAPARSVDTVAFPAYRRPVLTAAGPFDEELVRNQDDEYNYRLRKAGHTILLVPDMPVRYSSRARLPALFRQYYQYGFWKVRVLQKHPKQMSLRQFVPPTFVAALGLMPLLWLLIGLSGTQNGWLKSLAPWVAIAPLASYCILNAAIAVTEGQRRKVHFVTLGVAFALIHVGYGSGFLAGLFRFMGRWTDRADPPDN